MALNREQLLTACKRAVVSVEVPDLGGTVYLQALTGAEVASVYDTLTTPNDITQAIVLLSICDEAGVRTFKMEDRAEFFDKPVGVFSDLKNRALAINRLTKEAGDEARKA